MYIGTLMKFRATFRIENTNRIRQEQFDWLIACRSCHDVGVLLPGRPSVVILLFKNACLLSLDCLYYRRSKSYSVNCIHHSCVSFIRFWRNCWIDSRSLLKTCTLVYHCCNMIFILNSYIATAFNSKVELLNQFYGSAIYNQATINLVLSSLCHIKNLWTSFGWVCCLVTKNLKQLSWAVEYEKAIKMNFISVSPKILSRVLILLGTSI